MSPFFSYVIWVPLTLYSLAIIPQIIKNYRLQSTLGLSIPMVFARFFGELSYILYIYLLGLPLVYRVMIPMYTANIGIILLQAMYYAPTRRYRFTVISLMLFALACFMFGGILSRLFPTQVGKYAGWIAVSILSCAQIPQAYKNYRRESVHGFSLGYTLLMGAGSFIELLYVIYLQLPLQTLSNCIRSLLFYTVYWYQFARYMHDGVDEQEVM